jgi:hypothetical protein
MLLLLFCCLFACWLVCLCVVLVSPSLSLCVRVVASDGTGTWSPALRVAQRFEDELRAFAIIAAYELQNTSSYAGSYDTAEAIARCVAVVCCRFYCSAQLCVWHCCLHLRTRPAQVVQPHLTHPWTRECQCVSSPRPNRTNEVRTVHVPEPYCSNRAVPLVHLGALTLVQVEGVGRAA